MRLWPQGVSLIRTVSYRSSASYLLGNICFFFIFSLHLLCAFAHSPACLTAGLPASPSRAAVMREKSHNSGCWERCSMCTARNKGSGGKVGEDFCLCARITQYSRDNISILFFVIPHRAGRTRRYNDCIYCSDYRRIAFPVKVSHIWHAALQCIGSFTRTRVTKPKKQKPTYISLGINCIDSMHIVNRT